MTRWYYDDPLAAAWMAKHHGIFFQGMSTNSNSFRLSRQNYCGWAHYVVPMPGLCEFTIETSILRSVPRFYVAPDCVRLLEPQIGDILQIVGGHYHGNVVHGEVPAHMKARWTGGPEFQPPEYVGVTIIQRNGIAFHWPKEGDA